jgi:hypothetical protein
MSEISGHPLKTALYICDRAPLVSTVSSLFHIFARVFSTLKPATIYGQYLASKSISFHLVNLIPLARVILDLVQAIFKIYHLAKSKPNVLVASPNLSPLTSASATPPADRIPPQSPKKPSGTSFLDELKAAQFELFSRPRAAGSPTGDIFTDEDFRVKYTPETYLPLFEHECPGLEVAQFSVSYLNKYGIRTGKYTDLDLHVLTQEASEGCSAAVSCMLTLDHKKPFPYMLLASRKAENYTRIVQDIQQCGLQAHATRLSDLCDPGTTVLSMQLLSDAIEEQGSCVVRIKAKAAGIAHFVIVDRVDLKNHIVTLRDPWHGWFADVELGAFLDQWQRPFSELKGTFEDHIVQVISP